MIGLLLSLVLFQLADILIFGFVIFAVYNSLPSRMQCDILYQGLLANYPLNLSLKHTYLELTSPSFE